VVKNHVIPIIVPTFLCWPKTLASAGDCRRVLMKIKSGDSRDKGVLKRQKLSESVRTQKFINSSQWYSPYTSGLFHITKYYSFLFFTRSIVLFRLFCRDTYVLAARRDRNAKVCLIGLSQNKPLKYEGTCWLPRRLTDIATSITVAVILILIFCLYLLKPCFLQFSQHFQ